MYIAYQHQGAPLFLIAFATGFALVLSLLLLALIFLIRGRRMWALRCISGAMALAGLCLMGMTLLSLLFRPELLRADGQKYLCETGCRLEYSVMSSERVGDDFQVTVRTSFNDAMTSAQDSAVSLRLNPRAVEVISEDGRIFRARVTKESFRETLHPGESCETVLHFRLPQDVRRPKLLIRESSAVTRLLIGQARWMKQGWQGTALA